MLKTLFLNFSWIVVNLIFKKISKMKKIIIVLMFTCFNLNAQQGFVMFNQNKVEFVNQGKAYK